VHENLGEPSLAHREQDAVSLPLVEKAVDKAVVLLRDEVFEAVAEQFHDLRVALETEYAGYDSNSFWAGIGEDPGDRIKWLTKLGRGSVAVGLSMQVNKLYEKLDLFAGRMDEYEDMHPDNCVIGYVTKPELTSKLEEYVSQAVLTDRLDKLNFNVDNILKGVAALHPGICVSGFVSQPELASKLEDYVSQAVLTDRLEKLNSSIENTLMKVVSTSMQQIVPRLMEQCQRVGEQVAELRAQISHASARRVNFQLP